VLAWNAWAGGDTDARSCLDGVAKACIDLGAAVAKDEPPVGSVDELQAACDKTRDTATCGALLREQVKAACRNGKPAACRILGEGEAGGLAEATAPTTEALEASCQRNEAQACVDLATRLLKDQPSKQNQRRAVALLDRACKGKNGDACAKLGLVYVFSGKKADARRGEALLKRACDLGSKTGCSFQPPPPVKILKAGDGAAGPGLIQADDVGQTMKNLARLSKLLKQNCDLGYADACADLRGPDDPADRKVLTGAEVAARIRQLEKQAAAGPAPAPK
jgi:TPR repeat protein